MIRKRQKRWPEEKRSYLRAGMAMADDERLSSWYLGELIWLSGRAAHKPHTNTHTPAESLIGLDC